MKARNIINDLLKRHPANNPALIVRSRYNEKFYSFGELVDWARSLANYLGGAGGHGIARGDTIALMLDKDVQLMTSHLASWCLGAQTLPLFTLFGPEAVSYRVNHSSASLVISQRKYAASLAHLQCPVLYLDDPSFKKILRDSSTAPLLGEGEYQDDSPISLLYTSGTTGQPKGVPVTAAALDAFMVYMQAGLGVDQYTEYLNLADPAWAYGLYYSLMGPLMMGTATRWLNMRPSGDAILEWCYDHQITCIAASPSHYRLMQGFEAPNLYLKQASSAGEPLHETTYDWAKEHLGVPIYDDYGQTETGMLLCNHWDLPGAPDPAKGSIGFPMPGFDVQLDDDDQIVVATNSPLFWFPGYYVGKGETPKPLGHWYETGDTATQDPQHRFYFGARTDDVITSSGFRIGPFEIENVLSKLPGVAEAAVIGVPDEARGDSVVAFVVPDGTVELQETLLQQAVKSQLSAHCYPRQVVFRDELPKTPSLKVQRNVLKEQFIAHQKD